MARKGYRNSLSVEERQRLVEEHPGMVKRLAWATLRRYSLPMTLLDEMVGIGQLAFVEAASRYREREGRCFEFYAISCIRGQMLTGLKNLGLLEVALQDIHRETEKKELSLFDEKLEQVLDQLDQLRQSGRLTEYQFVAIRGRLKDRKTFAEIGKEIGTTGNYARTNMYLGLSKIGLTLCGHNVKNDKEVRALRRQMVVNHVRSAIPSGMSKEKLAVSIGISPAYIQKMFKDKKVPSLAIALLLARRLGKPVEELFQLDDRKEADHGNSNLR